MISGFAYNTPSALALTYRRLHDHDHDLWRGVREL